MCKIITVPAVWSGSDAC